MGIVSENGILSDKDYSDFKERSIRTKFIWQMFAAVGSATFFGLLMSTAQAVLAASQAEAIVAAGGAAAEAVMASGVATTFGGALAATIFSGPGIAFLAAGAVCVYMAQRFFFESQTLDQDFQAKKIAAATTRAQMMGLSQSLPEQPRSHTPAPGMAVHEEQAQEASPHGGVKWAEKVGADHAEKKPHDRHAPKPHVDNWADEIRLQEAHSEHASPTIH